MSIRPETSPAQIDFTVEGCDCMHDGKTSAGIYRAADGAVEFVLPVPGDPRPEAFTGVDGSKVLHERGTRLVEGEGEWPR